MSWNPSNGYHLKLGIKTWISPTIFFAMLEMLSTLFSIMASITTRASPSKYVDLPLCCEACVIATLKASASTCFGLSLSFLGVYYISCMI